MGDFSKQPRFCRVITDLISGMPTAVTETIVARIDRLVKEAVAAGKFRSSNHFWSPEDKGGCGLSRSYLSQFRSRLRRDPTASITFITAERIASALGVPPSAVIAGDDAPLADEGPRVEKYPNRTRAIEAARNLQLPDRAIRRILQEDHGRDLTRLGWFLRIYAESQSLKSAVGG